MDSFISATLLLLVTFLYVCRLAATIFVWTSNNSKTRIIRSFPLRSSHITDAGFAAPLQVYYWRAHRIKCATFRTVDCHFVRRPRPVIVRPGKGFCETPSSSGKHRVFAFVLLSGTGQLLIEQPNCAAWPRGRNRSEWATLCSPKSRAIRRGLQRWVHCLCDGNARPFAALSIYYWCHSTIPFHMCFRRSPRSTRRSIRCSFTAPAKRKCKQTCWPHLLSSLSSYSDCSL